MRKPTHLSGAAGAATGNSSPRNWLAVLLPPPSSRYLFLSPSYSFLLLLLPCTHVNSGIFNNCTCCAEKKSKQTSPKRTVGAGCGLSRLPIPCARPSPVQGEDEDDNDNDNDNVDAVKMTWQGCRCNERASEWQQLQRAATATQRNAVRGSRCVCVVMPLPPLRSLLSSLPRSAVASILLPLPPPPPPARWRDKLCR